MIEIEGLTKRFGPYTAVASLSLKVGKGEVLGFLGPNGAGKSTTMKMITGFLAPSSGRVSVCGHDVETQELAAQSCIGYLPEGARPGDMTARQFRFIAEIRGFKGAKAGARRRRRRRPNSKACSTNRKPLQGLQAPRRPGAGDPARSPVLIMDSRPAAWTNQKHAVRSLIRAMAAERRSSSRPISGKSSHLHPRRDHRPRPIVTDGARGAAARSRYHNAVTIALPAPPGCPLISSRRWLVSGVEAKRATARCRSPSEERRPADREVSAPGGAEKWDVKGYTPKRPPDESSAPSPRTTRRARRRRGWQAYRPIFKREFAAYFATPLAYVFIVIFLLAMGPSPSMSGASTTASPTCRCSSAITLALPSWCRPSPCACGRRATGTMELLLTLPIPLWAAVAGKFSPPAFIAVALALTFPIWLTVNYPAIPTMA